MPQFGVAPTLQGEAVRIVGHLNHQVGYHQGFEWDAIHDRMVADLPGMLACGEPLSAHALDRVRNHLADLEPEDLVALGALVVEWIGANPEPIPNPGHDPSDPAVAALLGRSETPAAPKKPRASAKPRPPEPKPPKAPRRRHPSIFDDMAWYKAKLALARALYLLEEPLRLAWGLDGGPTHQQARHSIAKSKPRGWKLMVHVVDQEPAAEGPSALRLYPTVSRGKVPQPSWDALIDGIRSAGLGCERDGDALVVTLT
ncbi:MAG: hypothetical protein H6734_20010 [Alphaproteobacteria bacterium]|nr:hypothetical protein [Alphaproteobacteria bacterium]